MNNSEITEGINDQTAIGLERRHESWDIRNIFKNYFFLAGTQIGSAVFSFTIVLVATRFFRTEGYGNIIAILAASQVVLVFVNWTGVALSRYGVEEFVKTGKISNAFVNRGIILLPNLLLLLLTSPLWLYPILSWLKLGREVIPFILLHFVMTSVWLHIQNSLQAAKLLRLQGLLVLLERVVILVVLSVIIIGGIHSWLYATLAYIFAAFSMAVIGYFKLRPYLSFTGKINKPWMRKILAFSLPLFPYTLTSFFSTNYLDAFFISKYLTKSDLGIYSVVYQVSGVLLQFPVLVGSLLMPLFVTLRTNRKEHMVVTYLQDTLPLMTFIWGVLTAFLAAACCFLLPLIFGPDLQHASRIIWIMIVGSTVVLPSLIGYSPFVTAAAAVFISFPLAFVTAATNLTGNTLLIPHWGLLGSTWATVLSYVMSLIFIILLIHRRFRFKHTWLFQAIIPSLVSIIYFSLRDNLWETLCVSLGTSLLVYIFYHRTIIQAARKTIQFRSNFK